jgi:ATP/maltotriose-dependent transcriptional regulator MalT
MSSTSNLFKQQRLNKDKKTGFIPINLSLINKVETLTTGVIVLNNAGKVIDANEQGLNFIRQMNQSNSFTGSVPQEILHLCESFIKSRALFPDQYWLMESRVFIDQVTAFHLQIQWVKTDQESEPYLLLKIEDEYRLTKYFLFEEALKYEFTAREREIWMLYKTNHTYKDIATRLGITPNTVKKHMKNIFVKLKTS